MYSGFSIIRTPIIRIRTIEHWLTLPRFWYQQEKDVVVTRVWQQEKAKLLHERLSQTLQCFFHAVRDLDHNLQRPSYPTYCITVWQIKRRSKLDLPWLQSLTRDQLIVALSLFYRPCPWFRRQFRLPLGLRKRVSVCLQGLKPFLDKVVIRKC